MSADQDPNAVFCGFLERRLNGEPADFDALCAQHPSIAAELRLLNDEHCRVIDLLGSAMPGAAAADAPAAGSSGGGAAPATGRYRVLDEIATGGMGTILHAWDENLRRNVAMKVALDRTGASRTALARFKEEAQVTAQLDHPGVVPVHELGVDAEGRTYFTMRLVRGRNLKHIFELAWAEAEGWNVPRALDALLKVCEAIGFAHEKRVIHRDLKPANIMVGRHGEVYVMDWGLARVLDQEDTHDIRLRNDALAPVSVVTTERHDERLDTPDSPLVTMDGDVVGTPAYMPPEQAGGHVEAIGPRADVYAVGAMLYHLLARQPPYVPPGTKVSQRTVLARVIDGPPRSLHELNADVPTELAAICEKAMSRDIADRYADTREMADDLRAYLNGRVVRAYETGAAAELRKWVRRNKGTAGSLAAAVLILAGGLVTTSLLYGDAEHARASERAQKDEVLRLADVQLLHDLKRRAERLWPELPERIAAMREWLADADRLSRNLEQHRRTLSELRAAAKPYDAATRASDRESFAHAETLALRERERQRLLQGFEPANAEPLSPTVRYQRLLELDREIETLERELDDRRRWVFADTETQWRHDTVAELVAGLADLPVLVSQVRDRLRRAECVAQDTTEAYAAEWEEATASIEDEGACPAYHGLQLEPQLGLVPIGRDRRSGLWEFALPRSGEIPARDGEGTLHIDESSALVFVLLPGGDFTMGAQGATPDGENYDRWSQREESPPHRVHLAPFFLAKYEMTQGQWLNVTGYNPSFYNAQADPVRHSLLDPVENVSYEECRSVLAHLGLVLPTEAQWEYGARGGTATIWWTGDDVRSCRGAANLADQSLQRVRTDVMDIESWLDDGYSDLAPVGQHQENGFGLHDTIGNVSEWCQDWYGVDGYRDPVRPGDGLREVSAQLSWRVSRGGSFYNSGRLARSSFRFHDVPEHRDCATGVRPARVITSP